MKVEYHPSTVADLNEAIRYYNDKQPELGNQLRTEIYAVIELIRKNPEIHAETNGVRRALVKRFPYSVIYKLLPNRRIRALVFAFPSGFTSRRLATVPGRILRISLPKVGSRAISQISPRLTIAAGHLRHVRVRATRNRHSRESGNPVFMTLPGDKKTLDLRFPRSSKPSPSMDSRRVRGDDYATGSAVGSRPHFCCCCNRVGISS
jgi:plasmid stabilization system protein ParE